jgi:hypothetical protein
VVLPSNLAQHSSLLCLIKHIKQWLHMVFVLNLDDIIGYYFIYDMYNIYD